MLVALQTSPDRERSSDLIRTGFITSGWTAARGGMSSARPAQLVVRSFASDHRGSLRTHAVYGLAPDLPHHAAVHPRLMPVSYETGSKNELFACCPQSASCKAARGLSTAFHNYGGIRPAMHEIAPLTTTDELAEMLKEKYLALSLRLTVQ